MCVCVLVPVRACVVLYVCMYVCVCVYIPDNHNWDHHSLRTPETHTHTHTQHKKTIKKKKSVIARVRVCVVHLQHR